jgi:SAM-dependent methyltransferase
LLAGLAGESWFVFMNHGYAPIDHDASDFPSLDDEDDKWRHQVFLYFYLLNFAKARLACMVRGECDLLDVGCGRGGGLAAMKRYYGLRRAVGIDSSPQQIAFCIDRHRGACLEFADGSAMAIPVSTESIDVVTNVESSHCYEDLPGFLVEVRRVLRPNGLLLLADNRERGGGKRLTLEVALVGSGLRLLRREDITERVHQACIRDADRFKYVFSSDKAEVIRNISVNSENVYSSGAGIYMAYCLEKVADESSRSFATS